MTFLQLSKNNPAGEKGFSSVIICKCMQKMCITIINQGAGSKTHKSPSKPGVAKSILHFRKTEYNLI